MTTTKAQILYSAISQMSAYMTTEQLRRRAEREYGCSYEEALEMAYDNLVSLAKFAKKHLPRPPKA